MTDHNRRAHDERSAAAGVAHLSDLKNFEVAEGYPDIRGWTAVSANGVKLGKVHDLIVDTAAMRTKYLCVELGKQVGLGDEREVIIPIGAASLNRASKAVLVSDDVVARVNALPAYTHGALDDEYEHSVHEALGLGNMRRPVGEQRAPRGTVVQERVVERRPIIEEVVVRRRVASDGELTADKLKREVRE